MSDLNISVNLKTSKNNPHTHTHTSPFTNSASNIPAYWAMNDQVPVDIRFYIRFSPCGGCSMPKTAAEYIARHYVKDYQRKS